MNRSAFYDKLRGTSMFPKGFTSLQVDGIESILDQLDTCKVSDPRYGAYIMATAFHETAKTMQPVRETLASSDAKSVSILDSAFAKGQLKWVKTPYWRFDADGKTWLGRGFVQLTHKYNYQKAKDKTGIDFVGNPSLAMVAKYAAAIIVRGMLDGWFTGKALKDYIGAKTDYVNARRIVNGTDKASTIAAYAVIFEKAFRGAWTVAPSAPQAAAPAPDVMPVAPTVPPAAPSASVGLFGAFMAILRALGAAKPAEVGVK